ncbi:MAG: sulfatase, partial [Planctomycetes bacterium]|nr:sulfatase [Planctomycetota bacterium]
SYGQTERSSKTQTAERPNILWISAEDLSPDLGCYGDQNAITPTLDRLAKEGVRFTRCFTHAAVCAPSRSGLITGCYPNSIGTHHMRCQGIPPENVKCFSEYLRLAGYYCTNNVKTDYQFAPPSTAWDESSSRADWRNRPRTESADGKISSPPFFCVINLLTTHEGQIRDPSKQTKSLVASLPPANRHDTSKLIVPPFYPDLPAGERSVSEIPSKLVTLSGRLAANRVRCDLANYYDNVTAMDGQVSEILQRLDEDGLSENTIVWFWGDHGRGMPRYKRWLYDTGTHVPLLIRVPSKWRNFVAPNDPESMKPGTVNSDLVAFVDFAPTILSLAGIKPKPHFQGQAFLGPFQSDKKRKYVYGHRDRMDETYDLIRTIRDHRYRYVRNFMPWQPYSQDITYMNNMPTMKEWRELAALGKLSGPAADWFRPVK